MSPELANKLGYKDKGYLTQMTQADGTKLDSGYMVSAQFTIESTQPERLWQVDAEVLPIGNRQLILGLSWLRENGLSLYPIKRTLTGPNCSISCSKLQLPTITLIESNLLTLENADCVMILDVTSEYSKYLQVFSEEQANRMPPHRKWDHEIPLKDGPNTKIPPGVVYKMTREEEEALRQYLAEMLPTGKVRRSRSAAAAPILFVRKKNGELRLCVDYRALNKLTIPNRYSLPRIEEIHEKAKGAKWFTRLDLKNGYNLIRIKSGDEWKTAFRTKLGLYEYTVWEAGDTV